MSLIVWLKDIEIWWFNVLLGILGDSARGYALWPLTCAIAAIGWVLLTVVAVCWFIRSAWWAGTLLFARTEDKDSVELKRKELM